MASTNQADAAEQARRDEERKQQERYNAMTAEYWGMPTWKRQGDNAPDANADQAGLSQAGNAYMKHDPGVYVCPREACAISYDKNGVAKPLIDFTLSSRKELNAAYTSCVRFLKTQGKSDIRVDWKSVDSVDTKIVKDLLKIAKSENVGITLGGAVEQRLGEMKTGSKREQKLREEIMALRDEVNAHAQQFRSAHDHRLQHLRSEETFNNQPKLPADPTAQKEQVADLMKGKDTPKAKADVIETQLNKIDERLKKLESAESRVDKQLASLNEQVAKPDADFERANQFVTGKNGDALRAELLAMKTEHKDLSARRELWSGEAQKLNITPGDQGKKAGELVGKSASMDERLKKMVDKAAPTPVNKFDKMLSDSKQLAEDTTQKSQNQRSQKI